MMSISTIATPGVDSSSAIASRPVFADSDPHPAALENARQREDVAHVVVDDEHQLALQVVVGAVQPLEHPLLLGRQLGDDAVQE